MIEFTGCFSGKAKKYYFNIEKRQGFIVMLIACLVVLPFWLFMFSTIVETWVALILFGVMMAVTFFALWIIPFDKKFIPKRIYIEDNYINVVLGNDVEEYKCLDDVKIVYDYGEFYVIKFYFGNQNNKFICQKNLISKGNLEEFEAMFEGKFKKRIKREIENCEVNPKG